MRVNGHWVPCDIHYYQIYLYNLTIKVGGINSLNLLVLFKLILF